MKQGEKVQRWMDLLASLLVHRYPATFEELAKDVPAYADGKKSKATLMRMFERDKDELRAFGVPIETATLDDGEPGAYRLRMRDFYLPYLQAVAPLGKPARAPRRIDRYGYHALQSLSFEPDELAVVLAAAERVHSLGDPLLALDAESAMRKLSVDLPFDEMTESDGIAFVPPRAKVPDETFELLGDALARRKRVSFDYHAMSTGQTERRDVEPYGLFFVGSHWYLAARDRARGELRNFRLNRISGVKVESARPGTPDYDIPADFHLREHARSREAWELGDGEATEAVVEFRVPSGAATAAARLGDPVKGHENRRVFRPRRLDVFARWLLSLQGDAVPLEPDALVQAYRRQIRDTLAIYEQDAAAKDVKMNPRLRENDVEVRPSSPRKRGTRVGSAPEGGE
ncbi:MAG TPA: WYL domain-containing protein [Gemmatimonadaceae bacterium]|nr:WYL domain-containing protein [Gemmatimonadaceae bacterium]